MKKTRQRSWKEFIPESWDLLSHYSLSYLKKDLYAGVTVGIVALPLAMAFAIASGVEPQQGLYTAIIAGFLISFLGGSKVQIGGPTGAFVVIVLDIVQRNGYPGLALATIMAALILIIMALCRLGTLIKYIPYPLVIGFTTGIAVLIATSQIKDFFGLHMGAEPSGFLQKWVAFFDARASLDPVTLAVALSTLTLILFLRKYVPRIPCGIVAILLATVVCAAFHLPVETIASRFGQVPRTFPIPSFPNIHVNMDLLQSLFPDAMTIALLAGIESLLSAVVADGMIGSRHKSNTELMAQGIANMGSIFFGGIPATGAIARTATNVKTGAMTPLAGMIHAVTLLVILLVLAPYVGYIPLAALSAVLMMVAWNMSEISHFKHLFRSPMGDVGVLLTAFILTVFVNLTVAVEVGMILAAFLFMKRMGDLSSVVAFSKLIEEERFSEEDPDAISKKKIPLSVEVYEINGPFFFGIADHLKDILHDLESPPKVFILRMRKVPAIDATGLHALREFYEKCQKEGTILLLSGVKGQEVKQALFKFGLGELIGKQNIFPHIDAALQRARDLVESS